MGGKQDILDLEYIYIYLLIDEMLYGIIHS